MRAPEPFASVRGYERLRVRRPLDVTTRTGFALPGLRSIQRPFQPPGRFILPCPDESTRTHAQKHSRRLRHLTERRR